MKTIGQTYPLSEFEPGDVGEFVKSKSWWSKKTFVVTGLLEDSSVCQFVGSSSSLDHKQRAVYLGRGEYVPARIRLGTSQTEAVWTDAQPTVPGWYWMRFNNEPDAEWCVHVFLSGDPEELYFHWNQSAIQVKNRFLPERQYAGPLPRAVEPNKGEK